MREIVKRHRRLVNSIVDVGGSVLGEGGQWHVTFYGSIDIDKSNWNVESDFERRRWTQQQSLFRETHAQGLASLRAATARDAQRVVSEGIARRNKYRHRGLLQMRNFMSRNTHSQTLWKRLAARVTHPRGPWASDMSMPTVWMLDPTEGPQGARIRLKPSHVKLNLVAPTRSGVDNHNQQTNVHHSSNGGSSKHGHVLAAHDVSIPLLGLTVDANTSLDLSSEDEDGPGMIHGRRGGSSSRSRLGISRRYSQLWTFVDYYLQLYAHQPLPACPTARLPVCQPNTSQLPMFVSCLPSTVRATLPNCQRLLILILILVIANCFCHCHADDACRYASTLPVCTR